MLVLYLLVSEPTSMVKKESRGASPSQHMITSPILQPQPPLTGGESPERFIKDVHMELESQELWNEFHQLGTEMILTRAGR